MAFDRKALAQEVLTNLGQAGSGVLLSEVEEIIYGLVGDGISSIPKAAQFLAGIPKAPRRIAVVALLNILKSRPDVFGAEYAPYVRAANEVVKTFAEGTGRAIADVTEDDGRQMAEAVIKVGETEVVVYNNTAHNGGGRCANLQMEKSNWAAAHPSTTTGGGGPRGGPTKTTPGTPFPEARMSMVEAMDQAITPCTKCMRKFTVLPAWATPSTPPKAKDWWEAYTPEEVKLIAQLPELFGEEAADLLEYLKKAPAVFIKPVLAEHTENGKLKKSVVPAIRDALFAWTDLDKNTKDKIVAMVRSWAEKYSPETLQSAIDAGKGTLNEVRWPALVLGVGLLLFFLTVWGVFLFGGWFFGNLRAMTAGTFLLPIMCLPIIMIPTTVDWLMDMFRDILRKFIPNTPFVDSMRWLYNLTYDLSLFIAVFGLAGMAVIGIQGEGGASIVLRVVVAAAGLLTVVKAGTDARWHFHDKAYRDAESTRKFVKLVAAVLLFGAIIEAIFGVDVIGWIHKGSLSFTSLKAFITAMAALVGTTASSTPASSMWGQTHMFWFWFAVIIGLGGAIALAVMMAQEESQNGVARGFRAAGVTVSFLAIVVAAIIAVADLGDWFFGFGDDPSAPSAQIVQPASTPTAVPSQPAAVSPQVAPTAATTSHPSAVSTPSGKSGGRKVDCSRIKDPVNRETCLRSSGH